MAKVITLGSLENIISWGDKPILHPLEDVS